MPSNEPSPRPWHTANFVNGIEDANNGKVAANIRDADAKLIVDAVNERDDLVENLKTANANRERESAEWEKFATELRDERDHLRDELTRKIQNYEDVIAFHKRTEENLRDIVRQMAETLEHVSKEHRFDFYDLVREARAAIGEDAK